MPRGINADEHPSTSAAIRDAVVLERHTIDDGNSVALFDGGAKYAHVFVANETDDETGVVTTDGGGDNATVVDGANFGNSSGNSNNNVFHDGSDYVLENSTGSDGRDYTVVGFRVV